MQLKRLNPMAFPIHLVSCSLLVAPEALGGPLVAANIIPVENLEPLYPTFRYEDCALSPKAN
jgi:hypothetical protein